MKFLVVVRGKYSLNGNKLPIDAVEVEAESFTGACIKALAITKSSRVFECGDQFIPSEVLTVFCEGYIKYYDEWLTKYEAIGI